MCKNKWSFSKCLDDVTHSAQRRLRTVLHHPSFDLIGCDLTEFFHEILTERGILSLPPPQSGRLVELSLRHFATCVWLRHRAHIDRVQEKLCYIALNFDTALQELIVFFFLRDRSLVVSLLYKSLMRLCTTRHWHVSKRNCLILRVLDQFGTQQEKHSVLTNEIECSHHRQHGSTWLYWTSRHTTRWNDFSPAMFNTKICTAYCSPKNLEWAVTATTAIEAGCVEFKELIPDPLSKRFC